MPELIGVILIWQSLVERTCCGTAASFQAFKIRLKLLKSKVAKVYKFE